MFNFTTNYVAICFFFSFKSLSLPILFYSSILFIYISTHIPIHICPLYKRVIRITFQRLYARPTLSPLSMNSNTWNFSSFFLHVSFPTRSYPLQIKQPPPLSSSSLHYDVLTAKTDFLFVHSFFKLLLIFFFCLLI